MPTGDTYGPANYVAYVPFELVLPWSGEWDALPSAHAASLFFDIATVFGLFVLGLRAGGRGGPGQRLGLILAFAWLTYPYTTYALQSNSNDSLVAALLVWGLVALGSPIGRGVLVGLAAMVKFAPLALVPLYAVGKRGLSDRLANRRERPKMPTRTNFLGARGSRRSDPSFSPEPPPRSRSRSCSPTPRSTPALPPSTSARSKASSFARARSRSGARSTASTRSRRIVLILAGMLAIVVAFKPGRRTTAQVAALAAAVVIASQLAVDHWFYLYIPWFCGLVFVALALPASAQRSAGASRGEGLVTRNAQVPEHG